MKFLKTSLQILILGLFVGCASAFDSQTHDSILETKQYTLEVMNKAGEPYYDHNKSIDSLQVKIDSLYSYEISKQNNRITVKMIEVISKKDGLIYGFIGEWKRQTTLSKYYIGQRKQQVSRAFDNLLNYEIKKKEISK